MRIQMQEQKVPLLPKSKQKPELHLMKIRLVGKVEREVQEEEEAGSSWGLENCLIESFGVLSVG